MFTYKHINKSSNVLAHHLVKHGVQRGEVVMVYAHRGVDLVVAVMGVLKAGATFSVIDPAYPPDRQIIYLDVAKPRALVVIEKASREAGEIDEKVRAYVRDELRLRTEVPGLKIQDDGSVIGGTIDGQDCLQAQQSLGADLPGVLVGPDSTPTLSFTSGSEGRPKGVKGRHFSLAYYFPWMKERFGLSERDHFSMLSGIAHDPIQRDIFTPLFLGAQLIVPPAEDITFDRLARWASENEISVTHLTPAMGQILLGSEEPKVKSLHGAFFVGDVLLKRDCRRLQQLAPNCRIKNMYGTTETQRAVSYYEIPSLSEDSNYLDKMGDVIPAGKGMLDVQLLVVDREKKERQCQVGEIGEIYVRAGGLAEGYLGNDLKELTNTKFVENWFVDPQQWLAKDQASSKAEPWREFYKGPRDRLYRSGDLGRYTADGNVECTGRADDQVKIRGFRIELGEIDTHLSQHPLIRENVTLVKRDQDEEPILVSYYVPDVLKWREWVKKQGDNQQNGVTDDLSIKERFQLFGTLTNNARDRLKQKLPTYAVPTLFIPMLRLPLTPNGKVDRRALPFPAKADLLATIPRATDVSSRSETERTLAGIWATHLKNYTEETLPSDVPFFDLGGDSLMAVRILPKLNKTWPVNLPIATMSHNPTLRALATTVDRTLDPSGLRLDTTADALHFDEQPEYYSNTLLEQKALLPKSIPNRGKLARVGLNVLLTGATGFLGAYVLHELLNMRPVNHVYAHVRSPDKATAINRIRQTCVAYGIWQDWWETEGNLEIVLGNLEKPQLGLAGADLEKVEKEADLIIHNGARVHWLMPYESLKAANVTSTVECIKLCATADRPKRLTFVSSTSALDTDHYVKQSLREPISESDDLEGSRQGLSTGYGQTKWVSEKLVMEAVQRGLSANIVRPGYVMGDSETGITNTDDFLVRMLKGCVQLGMRPSMTNTINMVPVNHVSKLIVASAFKSPSGAVCHSEAHPRLTFNEFLGALEEYGYTEVEEVPYSHWKDTVEKYVDGGQMGKDEFALMGLYHMVTGDLPEATRAPRLNDRNAWAALPGSNGVTIREIGHYLAFLVARSFMPAPQGDPYRQLPSSYLRREQVEALRQVGGRGGAA